MVHIPVLLDKVIETIGSLENKKILDCTFGAGGYSKTFLSKGGIVTAIDRDENTIQYANFLKEEFKERFNFIHSKFSNISSFKDTFDVIVFDFGVSSMQFDSNSRGFSFRFDSPLNMEMGLNEKSLFEILDNLTIEDLAKVLYQFGDIKNSFSIANAIKKNKPKTTFELKELIYNPKDLAPTFQALRIITNDEIGEINKALQSIDRLLNKNGICICVSFHSIEDRIVKIFFDSLTKDKGNPKLPNMEEKKYKLLKTFKPTKEDIEKNNRCRSAHLRAVQKLI